MKQRHSTPDAGISHETHYPREAQTHQRQLDCAFDPGVLSAWRGQVSNAARIPRLQQQLLHREGELLPRFARHYQELSALPRRMRRTLQRKWKQSLAAVALPVLVATGLVLGTASAALAADAVVSGTARMDTYEASVWRIPAPLGTNKRLVSKVKQGTATVADLTAAGATRLGVASDDYAPCDDHGSGCTDVFAVSLPGQTPSAFITWFQAQQACKNSGKRLPSNAEWQAAVAGTPDPAAGGPDNGTTDCNTLSTFAVARTGSRSSCVSADGAFDMVGNLFEWVADWVPRSTEVGIWSGSGDFQGLAGAAETGEPGALVRGGDFGGRTLSPVAGPLTVDGRGGPSLSGFVIGFRCAR